MTRRMIPAALERWRSAPAAFIEEVLHVLTTVLLFGGRHPEAICAANNLKQSVGRVFEAIRKIVECSPLLKREAKVTAEKIVFPAISATITAIPSDFAGAAGGNPTINSFDELF